MSDKKEETKTDSQKIKEEKLTEVSGGIILRDVPRELHEEWHMAVLPIPENC